MLEFLTARKTIKQGARGGGNNPISVRGGFGSCNLETLRDLGLIHLLDVICIPMNIATT
jgi:hypothetical protein